MNETRNVSRTAADQFKAEMEMLNNPAVIGLSISIPLQAFALCQMGQKIVIFSPEHMMDLAKEMILVAAQWERGEIEGLKKP